MRVMNRVASPEMIVQFAHLGAVVAAGHFVVAAVAELVAAAVVLLPPPLPQPLVAVAVGD